MKLNLGCGEKPLLGFVNVDRRDLPGVNVIHDLAEFPWPFETESVDAILAKHILEHFHDPRPFLDECYRVCKPGAYIQIEVPHWKHHYAHGMPDHFTTWAHNSFDPTYVTEGRFRLEYREARLFSGRAELWTGTRTARLVPALCKWTGLVSGLRFILRVTK